MEPTPLGDGSYEGELNEHWTIGPKVHGGAMLALCANAARTERCAHARWAHARSAGDAGDDGWQPVAMTGNYLWAPDPGPMRLVTSLRRRGRRVSLVDVELRQGERTAVRASGDGARAVAIRRMQCCAPWPESR
jgi:acyl-coenzyme A thioesterase PaaI-like protein